MKTLFTFLFLFAINFSAFTQWSFDTLAVARVQMAAPVVDNKIYYAGGLAANDHTNLIEILDTETGEWSYDTLSLARSFPSWTVHNDHIYFGGGIRWSTYQETDTIDVLNTTTGEWSILQLSQARLCGAVTLNDKIYFSEGADIENTGVVEYFNQWDVYEPATGEWSNITIPRARMFDWGGGVVGNKLYYFGGYLAADTTLTDIIDIFDADTETWSTAQLPEPMGFKSSVVVDDKIYLFGSYNVDEAFFVEILVYDTSTGEFTRRDVDIVREGARLAVLGSKVYFIGGGEIDEVANVFIEALPNIDIYDVETGEYTTDELQQARINHSVNVVGNSIYVAGGFDFNSLLNSIEIFTDETVGTDEFYPTAQSLDVFPNPSSDKIFIQLPEANTNWQLDILDGLGRSVLQQSLDHQITPEIDLSSLSQGIYFVQLRGDGSLYQAKVNKF